MLRYEVMSVDLLLFCAVCIIMCCVCARLTNAYENEGQRACLCRSDMCTVYLIDDDIVACCSAGSSHINLFSVSVASPFHSQANFNHHLPYRHSILIFI